MGDEFQQDEAKGRQYLQSFLKQIEATEIQFTEDQFDNVDCYFNIYDKSVVAEIKVRNQQYEQYDTHLMELTKYQAMQKIKKGKNIDYAYYICFFEYEDKITAYWYNVSKIKQNSKIKYMFCNRTTAISKDKVLKQVLLIPQNIAQRFVFTNNKWQKYEVT